MRPKLNKIPWETVDSSNVDCLFFDEPTGTICVRFNNGGIYSYIGADHETYTNLRMSPSVGRHLHLYIKPLPYTKWDSEDDLLEHLNI